MSDDTDDYVDTDALEGSTSLTPLEILGSSCPIKALGHSMREAAKHFHFIDVSGEVISLSARALTAANVVALFGGDTTWLVATAPNRTSKQEDLPGDRAPWKATRIIPLLVRACFAAGIFDPDSIRGPGVWPYGRVDQWPRPDARVVVHCGDRIYQLNADNSGRMVWDEPWAAGVKIGDFVYVRAAATDLPAGLVDAEGKFADVPTAALDDEAAAELRRFLDVWRWEDAGRVGQEPIAQFLFFGHIGAACIPGLLPRRPSAFVKGPSGAGKSEALKLECALAGGFWFDNATQTGVRKRFAESSPARAALCNEFESRGGSEVQRLQEIYDLARYCYSAGEGHYARAGEGLSGIIVAIFGFAAINPPHLEQQDANRMLLLSLGKLTVDKEQVRAFEAALPGMIALGPALRRRMIDRWVDYPKCFGAFRQALIGVGYEPRPADTFGTLLACGWLLSFGPLPDAEACAEWAQSIQTSLLASAMEESTAAWQRCLSDLLTARIEVAKDKTRVPVGKAVEDVFRDAANLDLQTTLKTWGLARVIRVSRAEEKKAKAENREPKREIWLAVANEHQGLEEIFKGTPWRSGGWRAVLGQMPGAERNHAASFGGAKRSKAILVPGTAVLPRDDDPEAAAYADDPDAVPTYTKDPFEMQAAPR